MLVCSVSLRAPQAAIVADIAEVASAADALMTGNVVFATLVDDPASVNDSVDAYLGEIMVEAASAADAVDGGMTLAADIAEATSANAAEDATTSATSPEVTQFLTRTSGLDGTHTSAYTALIDGLVADGVWAKLDVLHVYATQDSTTAKLNLVSASYTATLSGTPTFTADRGFQGNGSNYIFPGNFIPSSAPSPKFVRDSAHISAWNLTNSAVIGAAMGCNRSAASFTHIHPKFTDNNAYFRINGGNTAGVAMTDARGHLIANRSASNAVQGYKNGSSVLTNSDASQTVSTVEFYDLANNNNGSPNNLSVQQIAQTSIGSSLNGTEATAFYNRLRTYMTAVGVP